MSDAQLQEQVKDCLAIASCLGHNLSCKGLFGQPRRLVTDSAKRLCQAVESTNPASPVKYVLMNTTGNQNKQAGETVSLGQRIVVGLLRYLLPPHADNEQAARFMQSHYKASGDAIEWAAVRPDSLINEAETTPYEVHASPTRDAIFDAGKTSRINVAGFMSELIVNDDIWNQWRGQMPVIYNVQE